MEWNEWWGRFTAEMHPLWAAALLCAAVYVLANAVAWRAAMRRTRDVRRALADSTRSVLQTTGRAWTGRLMAQFIPAPDPFRTLSCEFTIGTTSPARFLVWPLLLRRQRLAFYGTLAMQPRAEVVWVKSQPPDRALGRTPGSALWHVRRLDYLHEEYAVCGANTGAIEHAIDNLQRRLGAFSRQVQVTRGAQRHFTLRLDAAGLNSEELPALVAEMCLLARAALHS